MAVIRLVLAALAIMLGYAAQRQHAYTTGSFTDSSLASVLQLVDKLNAQESEELQRDLSDSRRTGTPDVERLGRILTPAAERAGQLKVPPKCRRTRSTACRHASRRNRVSISARELF